METKQAREMAEDTVEQPADNLSSWAYQRE